MNGGLNPRIDPFTSPLRIAPGRRETRRDLCDPTGGCSDFVSPKMGKPNGNHNHPHGFCKKNAMGWSSTKKKQPIRIRTHLDFEVPDTGPNKASFQTTSPTRNESLASEALMPKLQELQRFWGHRVEDEDASPGPRRTQLEPAQAKGNTWVAAESTSKKRWRKGSRSLCPSPYIF